MKILTALIFVLFVTPAYAEIYKCIVNGNTTYQQTQCKKVGSEFIPEKDISLEQQKSAIKKLDMDVKALDAKKQQQKVADDKEREIRAQEKNAQANKAQAEETARQTKAIEESNANNNNNNNNRDYPYYYPITKPKPGHPIVKPPPTRPTPKPRPNWTQPMPSRR